MWVLYFYCKHIYNCFPFLLYFDLVWEECDCTESWGGCIMEETGYVITLSNWVLRNEFIIYILTLQFMYWTLSVYFSTNKWKPGKDLQYKKWYDPSAPSSWYFKAFTHLILCYFRVYHSRKFSKCSIAEYKEFLLRGGGACLFNRPTKVINALVVTTSAKRSENEIVPLKHPFSDLLKHLCAYFLEATCGWLRVHFHSI